MMRFRATVRNEGTSEASWFVYIHGATNGSVMAARFGQQRHAEKVARVMNECWDEGGRLMPVGGVLREHS